MAEHTLCDSPSLCTILTTRCLWLAPSTRQKPSAQSCAIGVVFFFFFFFFAATLLRTTVRKQCKRLKLTTRKGSNTRSAHSCHHSQLVTVIPHDLMDRRDGPLCSCGDAIQQGQSIRTCSSAPEHGTPPAHQRRVCSTFEQFWHATDFRRGQTSQEMGCLVRKSSSHFSPEDNQPCSAFCPCQLWVSPLFPCAGSNQPCTICAKTPPKFNEKTPRETQKGQNDGGKGKKKSEILGGPAEGGQAERPQNLEHHTHG